MYTKPLYHFVRPTMVNNRLEWDSVYRELKRRYDLKLPAGILPLNVLYYYFINCCGKAKLRLNVPLHLLFYCSEN